MSSRSESYLLALLSGLQLECGALKGHLQQYSLTTPSKLASQLLNRHAACRVACCITQRRSQASDDHGRSFWQHAVGRVRSRCSSNSATSATLAMRACLHLCGAAAVAGCRHTNGEASAWWAEGARNCFCCATLCWIAATLHAMQPQLLRITRSAPVRDPSAGRACSSTAAIA